MKLNPSFYLLVNKQFAMENGHKNGGFSFGTWFFSIAMLVITRGYVINNHIPLYLSGSSSAEPKLRMTTFPKTHTDFTLFIELKDVIGTLRLMDSGS